MASKLSLIKLIKQLPALQKAIEQLTKTPGAYTSEQIWQNVGKCVVAIAATLGFAGAATLTDTDIASASTFIALSIQGLIWFIDGVYQVRKRLRTPEERELLAKRAEGK